MIDMQREPVMISGLVTAVLEAFIMLALQMGWISWDEAQVASFNNFIVALMALGAVIVPLLAAYFARNRVTPVADPRTADGQPAQLVAK
jgi:fumarate reductase subunit D